MNPHRANQNSQSEHLGTIWNTAPQTGAYLLYHAPAKGAFPEAEKATDQKAQDAHLF